MNANAVEAVPPELAPLLDERTAYNVSNHAIARFRERVSTPLQSDDRQVRVVLRRLVVEAINAGSAEFWYDLTEPSYPRTLVVELLHPYQGLVALLREPDSPSEREAYDHEYLVITVLSESMARKRVMNQEWVKGVSNRPGLPASRAKYADMTVASKYNVDEYDGEILCITYSRGGRHHHELVEEREIDVRVAMLIEAGADPATIARWKKVEPEEREITVRVRY